MYRIDIKSDTVREIQRYLRELEALYGTVPKLSIDGIYGEETRASVRAFQRREGLAETGETDKETFEALYAAALAASTAKTESVLLPLAIFPMRMGDSGSYVRILQSVLNEILDERIPSDGFYGRATENGVRAAEARYGLKASGNVSRLLWQRLSADYAAAVLGKISD